MLSGKTPSEMRDTGIGVSHTYALLSKDEQKEWDEKIIFNSLPKDWNIHLHSMPETRGDNDIGSWPMYPNQDCRLLPDDICGRFREFKLHEVTAHLKDRGAKHEAKKIKGKHVNIWIIPEFERQREEFTEPNIEEVFE